ncbi:MAG: RICIN domain-containing protein, partial [Myxococcota bacterium]
MKIYAHPNRSLISTSLFACTVLLGGCMELDLESDDFAAIDDSQHELTNGTNTTGFAPVVRIENSSGGKCTGTAIADDLLVTAVHCLKSGNSVRSWIKVRVAHGANSSAQGAYSSYFMMSADVYDNVYDTDSDRDIAFVKFGAGTFSSWYSLGRVESSINGENVRLIGFGGNDTKSYGDDVVTATVSKDYGYMIARTNNSNGVTNTESGDSGGPMLRAVGGSYEVLGVLFGSVYWSNGRVDSKHVLSSAAVYDHVEPVLTGWLPEYCVENYQHGNYGGWSLSFCNRPGINGKFNADSFADPFKIESRWNYGSWNDELSSLKIPDNTVLTIYQNSGQGGDALTFQSVFPFGNGRNISGLGPHNFNDKVSSFRMTRAFSTNSMRWQIEITRYGKCLDLISGNTANGSNIQQWDCQNGNTNEIFRIESVGSYYQIKHDASGKCLEVAGASTSNGANIHLWTCDGDDSQLFSINSLSATSDERDFQIVNKNSGKCVDLAYGNSSNGANIHQWPCGSSNP